MPTMKWVKFKSCPPAVVVVANDGSGDATTIQAGINLLPATGGEVHIRKGTYNITSAITISKSNVSLVGVGKSTRIQTSSNITMISASSKDDLIIRNLYLYGSGAGATQIGIYLSVSLRSKIINCWIENTGGHGIALSNINNCIVENCWIKDIGNMGIIISGISKNLIINNYIESAGVIGIYASSTNNSEFKGNIINSATFSGIQMNSAVRYIIRDNIILSSGQHGIDLNTGDYNIIKGNICLNNSQNSGDVWSGIIIRNVCDHNIVIGNHCYDDQGTPTQRRGITETAGADRNIFMGNIATGNITGQINQTGANSIKSNNQEA